MRPKITRYRIWPLGIWPRDRSLRIVALADLHACRPWMGPSRIAAIVAAANDQRADVAVLLGDYVVGTRTVARRVDAAEWAPLLAALRAPLGVYAILGNHDGWDDRSAQERGAGPTVAGEALTRGGIRVLENEAVPLSVGREQIWLAGLGDQLAFLPSWRRHGRARPGIDDLTRTLAEIPVDAPAILLAHEPDIFPRVPGRVALTLSGHTHGGQVRLFGRAPVTRSRYGARYAYGHLREHGDLVVSGGLGTSAVPIRIGVPPEIVVVDLVADGG